MELFTIQIAKWRIAKRLNITHLDTTVKSGDKVFAPAWNMVIGHKARSITDEQYTSEYISMMRLSYQNNTSRWLEVATMDRVALACYCPANCFCHRLLLVDLFEKVCQKHAIPFKYSGEIQ